MSAELLAKIVAERNVLKDKLAAQQVKLSAQKDEHALKLGDLKQKLLDSQKREFEARVDAKFCQAEMNRHIAQRNLMCVHAEKLQKQVDAFRAV